MSIFDYLRILVPIGEWEEGKTPNGLPASWWGRSSGDEIIKAHRENGDPLTKEQEAKLKGLSADEVEKLFGRWYEI